MLIGARNYNRRAPGATRESRDVDTAQATTDTASKKVGFTVFW